jgi:general secretion pathway protein D
MQHHALFSCIKQKSWLLGTAVVAILAGCHDGPQTKLSQQDSAAPVQKPLTEMLAERATTENQQLVKDGIEALLNGRYEEAGEYFNTALLEDPTNSWLHYLNGLRYHMVARRGDVTSYDLAKAGYEQALKFDPTNIMASLQLGRVYAEQKEYAKAQNELANVLLIKPDHYDALYELACASYYRGDVKTARMAINRAQKIYPNKPEVRKAAAMILAAAGKAELADQELKQYRQLTKDDTRAKRLEGRIQDWRKLYKTGLVLAQADQGGAGQQLFDSASPPPVTADTTAAAAHAGAEGAIANMAQGMNGGKAATASGLGEMVVFDAVVLRVSEMGETTKGHNILDKFSVTLAPGTHVFARGGTIPQGGASLINGGSILGTAGFTGEGAAAATNPFSVSPQANLSVTKLFAQGLTFGNVQYSLNIANVHKQRIEVVGRPSLVASVGKPAKFFSGSELTAGLSGDNGGNLVKTPVGITLEVVPTAIKNGKITFDVTIYGSLVNANDVNTLASNTDITKKWTSVGISKINTSVEIGLGETILLGGLTERIDTKDKDGFPGLQDLPILQYFFSQEKTASERKSVMYLITPRTYDANKRAIQTADLNFQQMPNVAELEIKNKDWYDPDFNMIVTLRHLAPLYREYRHGDLDPLQWDLPENFDENLKAAASFLYY